MIVRIPSSITHYIFDFANMKMHRGRLVSKLDPYRYDAIKDLVAMQLNSRMRSFDCEEFSLVAEIRDMPNMTILSYVITFANLDSLVATKYGVRGKDQCAFVLH